MNCGKRLVALFSVVALLGCKESASPIPSLSTGVLAVEAGIVYRTGPQPVAREQLRVFDSDLEGLLSSVHFVSPRGDPSVWAFGLGLSKRCNEEHTSRAEKALAELSSHLVRTIETDFDGKAEVSLPVNRRYYVFAFHETGGGELLIWNVSAPIDSAGERVRVFLDQKNAKISRSC